MHEFPKPRLLPTAVALLATAVLALAGIAPAAANERAAYDFTDPASPTVLVNKTTPLKPADYVPDGLTPAGGSENLMVPEAAVALAVLLDHAANEGHPLIVESAYRSHARQAQLYQGYVARYGEAYASTISAKPGTSEHQLGLAADVGLATGECSLERCFGDTPAGKWVASNAAEFGFVVRYAQGQEKVTGFGYEPWHLRYLGVDVVSAMEAAGAETLEEFAGAGPAAKPARTAPAAGPAPRRSAVGPPAMICRVDRPPLDWYPTWGEGAAGS